MADIENKDRLSINYLTSFLKENLALISLFFYALGVAYFIVYYFAWGINIIEYITITDTLLLSVKFLFSLIVIVLAYSVLNKIMLKIHLKYKSEKSADYKFRLSLGGTIFPILFLIVQNFFRKESFITIELLSIAFFGSIYLLNNHFRSIKFFDYSIKIIFIISFILVSFKAYFDYFNNSKFLYQKEYISFQYEENTYIQSDSLSYIGQTENYTFLLDRVNDEKLIFSRNDIKKYTIHIKK